jgi:hypothetical protein
MEFTLQLLKTSPRNGKIDWESLSLLSGHACPQALTCLSKVKEINGKRKIVDGKSTTTRCFSATEEVAFPSVYNQRKHNFDLLRACKTEDEIYQLLDFSIRKSFDPFRIHVGGEFYNQMYFDAWLRFASDNPYRIFYAYTKSIPYWVNRIGDIPDNFSLTASYGGRSDFLIKKYNLKSAVIVNHPEEARELGLEIDTDDSHAVANDNNSFALLLHGTQPAGSAASKALSRMNRENIKYRYRKAG